MLENFMTSSFSTKRASKDNQKDCVRGCCSIMQGNNLREKIGKWLKIEIEKRKTKIFYCCLFCSIVFPVLFISVWWKLIYFCNVVGKENDIRIKTHFPFADPNIFCFIIKKSSIFICAEDLQSVETNNMFEWLWKLWISIMHDLDSFRF